MGAIAEGGIEVLHERVIRELGIPRRMISEVGARERLELERRDTQYRGGRRPPNVRDRTVILVDDGLATGATMEAVHPRLLLGRKCCDILRTSEEDETCVVENALETGRSVTIEITPGRLNRPLLVSVEPVLDENNHAIAVVCTARALILLADHCLAWSTKVTAIWCVKSWMPHCRVWPRLTRCATSRMTASFDMLESTTHRS